MEIVYDVLKPLSSLTDALAGEKQVTASAVIPVLKHVKSVLEPESADNQLNARMKNIIWSDLQNRYGEDEDFYNSLSLASFVDPRFKYRHLDRKEIVEVMKKECMEFYSPPCSTTTTTQVLDPPSKKPKGLAGLLASIEKDDQTTSQSHSTLSPEEKINLEITLYLEAPFLEPEGDPLSWWRREDVRYPTIAQVARKYLSICGISVPSERKFSLSGHIASDSRNRLLPENVNKLVFLAKNMD